MKFWIRSGVRAGLLTLLPGVAMAQTVATAEIADLSLEELVQVKVTSVTGRPQSLQESAASVFVITGEDIRRSTATSLPEALRLAPNLQVARVNAREYAISARGFNNAIGNKLLVLVDGRTVYSPLYSGVFWDVQDLMLEDIERIEVISGPGATLWGANAVNGVINVITRTAGRTRGALVSALVGNEGRRLGARYGISLGEQADLRIYALRRDQDAQRLPSGTLRGDHGRHDQAGFRLDWGARYERLTFQGDAYEGGGDGATGAGRRASGGNLLLRWSVEQADGSNWQLQAYADRARVNDQQIFRDTTETFDFALTHAPALNPGHRVLWGLGYRTALGQTEQSQFVRFDPARKRLRWSSAFIQDEIQVASAWRLLLGAKVETNVYTGAEFLPTVRASYIADRDSIWWGSLSRAVRAPARLDREFFFPAKPPFAIQGGPEFRSETADVLELGHRARPTADSSYSVTAFYSRYDRLRAGGPAPTTILNKAEGSTYGLEAWGSLDLSTRWRLSAGWVELRKSLRADADAGANSVENLGNDPRHQAMLRLSGKLGSSADLDATLRHVSALPNPRVPSYTAVDVGVRWRLGRGVEASLLARNLGGGRHIEFADGSEFGHSVFFRLAWTPE
ncbi:TonB-dependent receptor plug domain-containing protein [Azohydromonas aeria]|uniref:TonB-dependent receptor plug domain-containing protein n=1 Tax=Azohydromonas aeria TaxID=2590212 RepID=UPI0018DF40EC|nr:TonB-dependent receptor [Azohydromonas aeria]